MTYISYVENTTEGYYYIVVDQYKDPSSPYVYQFGELGFQNYTIKIHKSDAYTYKSAQEIAEGETVVNFTNNHHKIEYHKTYVEKNKNLIVYQTGYSGDSLLLMDNESNNIGSLLTSFNGQQVLSTSYTGYYYIGCYSPINVFKGSISSSSMIYNITIEIEDPVSSKNAEELSEGHHILQLNNQMTRYYKVHVEKNRMLWIRQMRNLSFLRIINTTTGILSTFCIENTSKSGNYYFKVDKYNSSIHEIELEIIIEPAYTVNNATEITAGTHDNQLMPQENFPYKYYKINVDGGKYLGFFINTSMSILYSGFYPLYGYGCMLNIIECTPSAGYYYIWIGILNPYLQSTYVYQLNITVENSYNMTNATDISTGKTNITLPKNNYPYVYYKIDIAKDKFFSVKIDNPLFDLMVFNKNGSILTSTFPDLNSIFSYVNYSTEIGQTYYFRIGTKTISVYNNFLSTVAPNIFYDKCQIEINVANGISLSDSETISLGDSITGNLDPYGIKKYQIYLVGGKYFKIKTNHPSTTGYCAMTFSDAAGTLQSEISSYLYPLSNVYYIQNSGIYNLTITGAGAYNIALSSYDVIPVPEYCMPIQKNSWASYDFDFHIPEELSLIKDIMMIPGIKLNPVKGRYDLVITNIDHYTGNYIINNSYLPAYLTSSLVLAMPPPFIPTNFDMNLMANLPFFPIEAFFNYEIFNNDAIDGEYTNGTYTINGKIFNTIVYTIKINSISYISLNYEKNTGVLLSAEVPNIILEDFGEFSYSVNLVDTDILDLSSDTTPIPAFNFAFILLAILALSMVFIIQLKNRKKKYFLTP
ncbi:MAG: hypothetical protein GF329_09110 [Candidatus Lokiarchaeota archaeon]|nr:hypothetical protein [Candidatus Lokiarchaeota archaeon]